MSDVVRPEVVKSVHLVFLDSLREGGKVNMFGAPKVLEKAFRLDAEDAKTITAYWMKTFGGDR